MLGLDSTVDKATQDIRQILAQFEDAEGNIVNVTADKLHGLLVDSLTQAFNSLDQLETKAVGDLNASVDAILSRLNGSTLHLTGPLSGITGDLVIQIPQKGDQPK